MKICNITKLSIDKQTNHVAYNDHSHRYWNINTGEFYTSSTTHVAKYKQKFDSELVSSYKAIEKLYPDYFSNMKSNNFKMNDLTNHFITSFSTPEMKKNMLFEASNIRNEWKQKGESSAKRGTAEHLLREQQLKNNKTIFLYDTYICQGKQYHYINDDVINSIQNRNHRYAICFPELLLYSDKLKLAGQTDLLCLDFELNSIDVYDYKTNNSIEVDNKYKKMLHPFSSLDDCSLNHYSLQLSLYAFMFKEIFSEYRDFSISLNLIHIKENQLDKYIKAKDLTDMIL